METNSPETLAIPILLTAGHLLVNPNNPPTPEDMNKIARVIQEAWDEERIIFPNAVYTNDTEST